MSIFDKARLFQTSMLAGAIVSLSATASAQDVVLDENGNPIVVEEETVVDDNDRAGGDEVVVTGSRIKRNEFSSIAPIQIINFDQKADVGLVDPVEILQTSEAASGQQIDSTFGGFVLDNGPGSETIDIRGLGADRTLVLLNSRRMGPIGVEGAPGQPSINLIPGSLVENVDILLEGASSIYGSDAVAGVVNVILKKDFEGFEVEGVAEISEQGGEDWNISGSYGKNWDRGFIGIGAEYDYRDRLQLGDRDFLAGCDTHYEIDENGQIRTGDNANQILYQEYYGDFNAAGPTDCKADGIASRLFEFSNTFGSIYGGTGTTNIGIPGYVDQTLAGVPIDANGDGVQDYNFNQFSINGNDLEADLIPEQKRYNLMAFGEYTFEGEANITPFFEVLYSNAKVEADNGTFQLFPDVNAANPFNPCGVNGADCGSSNFDFNDAFNERWNIYQRDRDPNRDGDNRDSRICARIGVPIDPDTGQYRYDLATGPFDSAVCTPFVFGFGPNDLVGPQNAQPIVGVNGDRSDYFVELEQLRLVGGFKGDIPWLNFGDVQGWSFETSLTHSFSQGDSSRPGIRDDRLNFALGNDIQTGNIVPGRLPCEVGAGEIVRPDVLAGCVPVNLFADSLYTGVAGDFASQAERDYLFDNRTFDTKYKQTTWSAFATGSILELPAGKVNAVVGLEYRVDEIESTPSEIARDGLFFGFFSDGGAQGRKFIQEAYAEIDIPLVADKPGFSSLDVNLSGRVLEEEFYGAAATYAAKVGWRPVESLLLKASYGTSFRSPNLRENFLQPQTGFLTLFDPCSVPAEAIRPDLGGGPDVYDALLDTREPDTLDRCRADGIDPTTFNAGGTGFFSTEVFSQGTLDLDPETSTSFTAGFSFEQPFTDAVDFSIGANYYDIEVTDTLITPSAQFIINDCYVNERQGRSPFCDRITRRDSGRFDLINQEFLNQDKDKVRGLDITASLGKDFTAFDRPFELDMNFRANHIIEVSQLFIGDEGDELSDNDEGEFGFADWTGSLNTRLKYNDFSVSLFTRYVGAVAQDEDFVDDFSNAFGIDTEDNGVADTFSNTCGGPAVGDVNCRDVGFAGDYWIHNLGVRYDNEDQDWGINLAVRNIFDKAPPKVDSSEVTAISNTPIGAGYDLRGRTYVATLRKGF